jgi:peroxiredoxin (alkyl hydroperoxide reductase subunit C)
MSLIGQKEPQWAGTAHVKGEQKQISSKDYTGKWHVLYWYPLDFTFVCPTEIRGFQDHLKEFADDAIDVIGVSTDSFYSHKAWFADRQTFPSEITHPVLADTNHSISRAFGVLKEDAGIAYRASVVVDDKGVIRAYHVNDTSVGRSPREVLRTVQALQSGGLCAADWKKGEKFVA